MIGTRLGPYELIEELGQGGMATVYRAYQPSMDRHVAVKVIRRTLADDPTGLERFQREARLIAKLEHPHLLPVYDYNGTHDPPYIVMRYLAGGTLKDALGRGPLPSNDIIHLLRQIASALDYAHGQGVVHRDLKPSNIMIDGQGNAFLADFGIARLVTGGVGLTQTGLAVGTPSYMSPEQGLGQHDVGPRADLYALGVMLFELLTGQLPFTAETAMGVVLKHLQSPIPSATHITASLPPEIDAVIAKAMAKQPEGRYATAGELAQAAAGALSISHTRTPTGLMAARGAQTTGAPPTPSKPTPASTRQRALAEHAEQRRQVAVLYVDDSEFERALYDTTDPEDARDMLDRLWASVDAALAGRGGVVVKRTDSSLTALWGAETTREDDPEQAIRAALAVRDATREFAADETLPTQIGLTAGMALLTLTPDNTFTASGSAISMVSRLIPAVPEGGIVITEDLYRLVRGVFSVEPLPPLRVRGSKDVLEVFLVKEAKPRVFRIVTRGVEGLETQMIGRDAELKQLQDAWETALEDDEAQMVTLLGEAGVGKSRLLNEFEKWFELRPEGTWIFKGRATPGMTAQPYSLLRDVFMFRFEIQESDPPPVVRAKMEKGVAQFMGPGHEAPAHLLGQLLGFDFQSSPHVQGLLNNAPQLHERATHSLLQFFRAVPAGRGSEHDVALLMLEDMHWADEKSLDALLLLLRENADTPLMILCLARPALIERRPAWGIGLETHTRLTLRPLARRDGRKLVKEILKKVADLPDELRDLIVERSEGNPLYMEELVKVLLEDRVIIKGEEAWRVETERLASLRVPPTLTGVLQARLDSLPPDERTALQRAAVIGRVFWDFAVAGLEAADGLPIPVAEALTNLQKRELIFKREPSAIAGAQEYIFASNMVRDVAYESTLKRQQRAYHALVAEWLVGQGGARAEREYTSLIAEHYERAGEAEKAAAYLKQAGESALQISAFREAIVLFERGLALLPADEKARVPLILLAGEAVFRLGDYAEARRRLEAGLALARQYGDDKSCVFALDHLGSIATEQGAFAEAKERLAESLELARRADDQEGIARTLQNLGWANSRVGAYEEAQAQFLECRAIYEALGNKHGISRALNGLGTLAQGRGDYEAAKKHLTASMALCDELGDRRGLAVALANLGENARIQGDYATAEKHYNSALTVFHEVGSLLPVATSLGNLGHVASALGHYETAEKHYHESLKLCMTLGALPTALESLAGLAGVYERRGQTERALELLGLVLHHPALLEETRPIVQPIMARLEAQLSGEVIAAGLARGQGRDLPATVSELTGASE